MARTADQTELGIVAEKFTEREKKIRALLREYRTIDRRIEYFERLAKGDGLLHQPSVTAAPPIEDDPWVLVERLDLSQGEQDIVDAVKRHISTEQFKGTYISAYQVARELLKTFPDNRRDDYRIRDMWDILKRKLGEERVELTDTERLAIRREEEINQARQKLATLREHKRHVGYALDTMREYYPYSHNLLVWRYIEGYDVETVQEKLGEIRPVRDRQPVPLSRDEWINDRRDAMHEFAKWLPQYLIEKA